MTGPISVVLYEYAEDSAAVPGIFQFKGRPPSHPLIVHIGGAEHLDKLPLRAANQVTGNPPVASDVGPGTWH